MSYFILLENSDSQLWFFSFLFQVKASLSDRILIGSKTVFHSTKINEADSLWFQAVDKTVKAAEMMLGLQAVILAKIK